MKDDEAQQDPPAALVVEPRLRLRSLKVHQFREVKPGTSLEFGEGFHLILGKNATGKSTLLSLLAAVSALDFRRPFFAETPFHLEASFTIGDTALHAEVQRRYDSSEFVASGGPAMGERADVVLRIENARCNLDRWVRVRTGTNLEVRHADPRLAPESRVEIEMPLPDPLRLPLPIAIMMGAVVEHELGRQTHPAMLPALTRTILTGAAFDEALGTLHTIEGHDVAAVVGLKPAAASPWLPRALQFDSQGEPVSLDLSRDSALDATVRRLGFDGARAHFGPGASLPGGGWSYSSPSFQFFRNGKAVRRHDQLSFGQQRLFSFAWYLACNPDVAIADELVNGLHSEWIDWCVEAMRDRQCFLTSQNPLLVDAVPFATEEDIRRGIILCSAEPDPSGEGSVLSWRQLDDREVEILSRALQDTRLDLLSDLLHALDLW
jgi:energy-coupling factor transporter ATP-binding protein EcfA2